MVIPTVSPLRVLVVGDWVIDEHWVVGRQRSGLATRMGDAHYRALHQMNSTIVTIQCAGLTASILKRVGEPTPLGHPQHPGFVPSFDVYGLGLWSENDTQHIELSLDPANVVRTTRFAESPDPELQEKLFKQYWTKARHVEQFAHTTINQKLDEIDRPLLERIFGSQRVADALKPPSVQRPSSSSERMFNLADVLPDRMRQCHLANRLGVHGPPFRRNYATTRIVRLYEYSGASVQLLHRVDWEFPAPGHQSSWFDITPNPHAPESLFLKHWAFANSQGPPPAPPERPFHALIVYDAGKGVVSRPLIDWLIANNLVNQSTQCFVMTRKWNPGWLATLKGLALKLVFVHQTARPAAISGTPFAAWFHRPKGNKKVAHLTREAITAINELLEGDIGTVIVQVKDFGLIAVTKDNDKIRGIAQVVENPMDFEVEPPIGSILYSSLVARLLLSASPLVLDDLRRCLGFSVNYILDDHVRFDPVEVWNPCSPAGGPPRGFSFTDGRIFDDSRAVWHSLDWRREEAQWQSAMDDLGIIFSEDPDEEKT